MEAIIRRHAGVLGLCGCVQAFPYTVTSNMPQILMEISGHVNDPQPIQVCTIVCLYAYICHFIENRSLQEEPMTISDVFARKI